MRIDLTKVKLLNRDILIRLAKREEVEGHGIFIIEDGGRDENQFYEVVRASEAVKHVKAGDTVVLPWRRVTDPFDAIVDGHSAQYGITSEDEVLAVVED